MDKLVACKNCATEGLKWSKTAKGWRLFDESGDMHRCEDGKRTTNDAGPKARSAAPNSDVQKLAAAVADLILKVDALTKEVEKIKGEQIDDSQLNLFGKNS